LQWRSAAGAEPAWPLRGSGFGGQLEFICAGFQVENAGNGFSLARVGLQRLREGRPAREDEGGQRTQRRLTPGSQPGGIEHLLVASARIDDLKTEREQGPRASAVIGHGDRQDKYLSHVLRPIRVCVINARSDEYREPRCPQGGFIETV